MSIAAGSRSRTGHATYKEGIDMGPDVAYGAAAIEADDYSKGGRRLYRRRPLCPAGMRRSAPIIGEWSVIGRC